MQKMFVFSPTQILIYFDAKFYTILIIAAVLSIITAFGFGLKLEHRVYYAKYSNRKIRAFIIVCTFLLIISISSITSSGFNPFIYFRF